MEKGRGRESYRSAEVGIDEARESTRETERERDFELSRVRALEFQKAKGRNQNRLSDEAACVYIVLDHHH